MILKDICERLKTFRKSKARLKERAEALPDMQKG